MIIGMDCRQPTEKQKACLKRWGLWREGMVRSQAQVAIGTKMSEIRRLQVSRNNYRDVTYRSSVDRTAPEYAEYLRGGGSYDDC